MLTITHAQMNILELDCYRRQCIYFVEQELQLFDYALRDKELQLLFEQFHLLLDIQNRNDRLTLVLLLIASLAFQNIFTQHVIARFMEESMTPEERSQKLQHALLQHVGYDTEFLYRKTWI
jgi:hypothetical protein